MAPPSSLGPNLLKKWPQSSKMMRLDLEEKKKRKLLDQSISKDMHAELQAALRIIRGHTCLQYRLQNSMQHLWKTKMTNTWFSRKHKNFWLLENSS